VSTTRCYVKALSTNDIAFGYCS